VTNNWTISEAQKFLILIKSSLSTIVFMDHEEDNRERERESSERQMTTESIEL